jgi:hypothetical protein
MRHPLGPEQSTCASSVTPDYRAPFPFTCGTIDKAIADVSGEPFLDHEREVMAWVSLD